MELSDSKPLTVPLCAYGDYDCKNCGHPFVAQTPKGPLKPCDGTIHFCRFATEYWYPQIEACKKFNMQNYHCVHGGGTCPGYPIIRNRLLHVRRLSK
jgi:hypothetical protein